MVSALPELSLKILELAKDQGRITIAEIVIMRALAYHITELRSICLHGVTVDGQCLRTYR